MTDERDVGLECAELLADSKRAPVAGVLAALVDDEDLVAAGEQRCYVDAAWRDTDCNPAGWPFGFQGSDSGAEKDRVTEIAGMDEERSQRETRWSSDERACFLDEHDRDVIDNRIDETALGAMDFLLFLVELQIAFALRAGENFFQLGR